MTHENEKNSGAVFAEAVAIMARLRAPGGCPWDREQSFDTIRRYTLEETYEVLDAIERRHWDDLREELGDLLLQVLFYAQMASEEGLFDVSEVILELNRKLIRRHPHVFGDEAAAAAGNRAGGIETAGGIDAQQVLRNWDAIKAAEKAKATASGEASRLDSIPRALPALMEAAKLGSRAAKSGFDWADTRGLFNKIQEETAELTEAIELDSSASTPESRNHISEELGDLLFTVVNLARHLKVDPEMALRQTNAKFRARFGEMERSAPAPLEDLPPEALERAWEAAKQEERRAEQPSGDRAEPGL